LIFTGIAVIAFSGNIAGEPTRDYLFITLDSEEAVKITHEILQISATASLNAIDGPGGWYVDSASANYNPHDGLVLRVKLAADLNAVIRRVAYTVYVVVKPRSA
jgi:hypothetical protein